MYKIVELPISASHCTNHNIQSGDVRPNQTSIELEQTCSKEQESECTACIRMLRQRLGIEPEHTMLMVMYHNSRGRKSSVSVVCTLWPVTAAGQAYARRCEIEVGPYLDELARRKTNSSR